MKDYFNPKKYTLLHTKTEILPKNKTGKNQNVIYQLYPSPNPDYNYYMTNQNFFRNNNNINNQFYPNKTLGPTFIPYNIINNNISSNDRIYQKYFYINENNYQKNNHPNTVLHRKHIFLNNNRNSIYDQIQSPMPTFINDNNDSYIYERLNNKKKNFEGNNLRNKTTNYLLSDNISNFYSANKNDNYARNERKTFLNIYKRKMIESFVKIINKIIEKNKKKEISKKFFNNFKKSIYRKKIDNNYFKNEDPKFNEYKDMIYNYIKCKNNLSMTKIYNILKPKDRLNFNTINAVNERKMKLNKKEENNNNSLKITSKKNQLERFRQLQKKYGKIYEKKKNESLTFEEKIKNYINSKTIESTSSNNNNDNTNDVLRKKLLFKRIQRHSQYFTKANNTEEINYISSIKDNSNNNKSIYENKNKIINNKKKFDTASSNKSCQSLSENRNSHKIYIFKNIATADRRIYVYMSYINSDYNNNKKEKKFYDNNILEISNIYNMSYIGNNCTKSNLTKFNKKLSKIDEEIDDQGNTNLSMSFKDNNKYSDKKGEKEMKILKITKRTINNNIKNNNKKDISKGSSNIRKKYIIREIKKNYKDEEN